MGMSSVDEWKEFFDDRTERPYWYNEHTGQTTWLRPAFPATRPSSAPEEGAPSSKRLRVTWGDWSSVWDSDRQRYYWYNQVTEESQWAEPWERVLSSSTAVVAVDEERAREENVKAILPILAPGEEEAPRGRKQGGELPR
eukprot:Hpha_TRINITY_DN6304_c0_g1::TRINITY_DN6304_c0_g1_i1::g.145442::m.145442